MIALTQVFNQRGHGSSVYHQIYTTLAHITGHNDDTYPIAQVLNQKHHAHLVVSFTNRFPKGQVQPPQPLASPGAYNDEAGQIAFGGADPPSSLAIARRCEESLG